MENASRQKNLPSVTKAPFPLEIPGFHEFPQWLFYGALVTPSLILVSVFQQATLFALIGWFLVTAVPSYALFMIWESTVKNRAFGFNSATPKLDLENYLDIHNVDLKQRFHGKTRIPMQTFFEAYFDKKIDIHGDMLDLLENRHDWASFQFTLGHIQFLAEHLLPEALFHSKNQDETQVRDHYDRGNDFYEAFLGPMMIYTSGIINDKAQRESLEVMQENKMNLVCEKIQLKEGERMLDIGCGWGTLLAHAAKKYGAKVTGVTLAREQTEFGNERAREWGVQDKVNIMCADYRDIPRPNAPNGQKYDKITCLEMAEHVGVRKFNRFLNQVMELLEDDGVFYLQIAGLRRPWQYEDLVWGLFMNKYIFPGADASCPLAWVIGQLEYAGFEVQQVDTIGVHYSATLERWYRNWMKPENRQSMIEKYGERQWRVWEFFLAWSTIIARQGSATCFQIVCHKNKNAFDRTRFMEKYHLKRLIA